MGQVVPISDASVPLIPPHNQQAEQALLAAILVNNRCYEQVADFLRPQHFFDPTHARLYLACEEMIGAGHKANVITVRPYLAADPDAAEWGGASYAQEIIGALISSEIVDYGRAIVDAANKRTLIEIADQMRAEAYGPPQVGTAEQIAERNGAAVFETIHGAEGDRGIAPFSTAVDQMLETADKAHKSGGKLVGLPTGLIDLNRKLGGLHPSDLIILAGRPSMGKTALATNIAFHIARQAEHGDGAPVGFWSLEMNAEQLAGRIVAGHVGVSSHAVRQGELKPWEMQRFVEGAGELRASPLHIDDSAALTIERLRLRVRAAKRRFGIGCAVVDYLQLLRSTSGKGGVAENRTQEISEITRGLKAIAKELHIPMLALSQLSRQLESREDKRPQLSDLRESGSIEQDADAVLFVYREQYYLERAEPGRRADESDEKFRDRHQRWEARLHEVYGTAEVIIAKQRHGPVGTVHLAFDADRVRFGNLETRHHE